MKKRKVVGLKKIVLYLLLVFTLNILGADIVNQKLEQLKKLRAVVRLNSAEKAKLEKIGVSKDKLIGNSAVKSKKEKVSKNSTSNLFITGFKQLLKELLEKNLLILASKNWVKAGKYVARQAKALEYPFINFQLMWERTDIIPQTMGFKMMQGNLPADMTQMPMLFMKSPYSNVSSAVGVYYLITAFGRKQYMKMMGQYEWQARKFDAKNTKNEMILKLVEAYVGALLANKYIKLSQTYLKNAKEHVRIATEAHKQGMIVKSDVLRAKVFLSTAKEKLIYTKGLFKTACYAISMLISSDHKACYALKKNLREPNARTLDGFLKKIGLSLENLDVNNNPELLALKKRLKALENQYKEIKSRKRPHVYFMGQERWDDDDSLDGENSWYMRIGANFDLYKGGMDIALAQEKKQLIEYFKNMIEFKKRYLNLELLTTITNLKDAWENIKVKKVALSAAKEQYKIVKNMYKNGMAKMVELLDAETALEDTQVKYWKYVSQFWVEFFRLMYITGKLDGIVKKIEI